MFASVKKTLLLLFGVHALIGCSDPAPLTDGGVAADGTTTGEDAATAPCVDGTRQVLPPTALDGVDAELDGSDVAIAAVFAGEAEAYLQVLRPDGIHRIEPLTVAGLPEAPASSFISSRHVDLEVSEHGYAVAWATFEEGDADTFLPDNNRSSVAAYVTDRDGAPISGSSARSLARDAYNHHVETNYPRVNWMGEGVWFTWSDRRTRERTTGQVRQASGIYGRRLDSSSGTWSGPEMLVEWASSSQRFAAAAGPERLYAAWIAGGSDARPHAAALPALGSPSPIDDSRLTHILDLAVAPDGTVHTLFGALYESELSVAIGPTTVRSVPLPGGVDGGSVRGRIDVDQDAPWIAWADDAQAGWRRLDDAGTEELVSFPDARRVDVLAIDVTASGLRVLLAREDAEGMTALELHERCF